MTDLLDDLDDEAGYLPLDPEAEWPLEEPCPPPPDEDVADRMLRTMRGLDRQAARVDELVRVEVGRIERFADDRRGVIRRRREYLERSLEQWGRAINADQPKRATLQLPNGTVSVRTAQPRLEAFADDETLERIAKEHPGWVRRKPAAAKDPIKRATKPGRRLEIAEVLRLVGFGSQVPVGEYHLHTTLVLPERCGRCGEAISANDDGEWDHDAPAARPQGDQGETPCLSAAGPMPPQVDVEELPGVYWLIPREAKRVTVRPA
jgi:hypothetical protein